MSFNSILSLIHNTGKVPVLLEPVSVYTNNKSCLKHCLLESIISAL